jgi:hypothetical protein
MAWRARFGTVVLLSAAFGLASCGGEDEGHGGGNGGGGNRPDQTGAACETPDDCYPDVASDALQGEAECITSVRDGYCTHTCESDDDCCAADGECKTELLQVCSPFESLGGTHCFLSCEPDDVAASSDVTDEQDFCQKKAGSDFICRSSGGGSANRKVCVPGDCGTGASCSADGDCAPDLVCIDGVAGGYCSARGCTTNDECGADALCVDTGDEHRCYRRCSGASDCAFCRFGEPVGACSADVTFVEAGTTGSVCTPG